jgi:uncharacterized protein YigE (DUF2233 family)
MRHIFIGLSLLLHTRAFAFVVETKSYADVPFRIARIDLHKENLKLYWKNREQVAYGTLKDLRTDLRKRGETFLMATNAGMYDPSFKPLGLHIEGGKELHALNKSEAPGGNFSMVPNGVFLVTKTGARIVESKAYARQQPRGDVQYATQSGPLLLENGKTHPAFTAGSTNRKLRSGVGVNSRGEVVFAISDGFVSFYNFAMLFKTVLDCKNALYLDGSISSMLVGDEPVTAQLEPFTGILAVTMQ